MFRPGFLSMEFTRGRRQSYLDPIRMYLFTSALFFILFFWLVDIKDLAKKANVKANIQSIESVKQMTLKSVNTREDSMNIEAAFSKAKKMIAPNVERPKPKRKGLNLSLTVDQFAFTSFEEYDSIQNALKPELRDGWLKRRFVKKGIEISNKYAENKQGFVAELFELFMHHIAQLLFVSLPIFAFFLQLLYTRKKNFYYADHAIFAIHLYIFSFIMLMVYFGIQLLETKTGWAWLSAFTTLTALLAITYYFIAMKNFYQQGVFRTIVKFTLLTFLSIMMMVALFLGFGLFSLWET